MTAGVADVGTAPVAGPVIADAVASAGLEVRSVARWPESAAEAAPPPLAGFVVSSFSPLVAEVAERCLRRHRGDPPAAAYRDAAPPADHRGTAVVLVSALGDLATAVRVAHDVDAGTRIGPLLFFQSVPNAVAGYVAARWGLAGPVVCTSPVGDPLADGLGTAALLIADGDADEALVLVVEQSGTDGVGDRALAVLVRGTGASGAPTTATGGHDPGPGGPQTQSEGVPL